MYGTYGEGPRAATLCDSKDGFPEAGRGYRDERRPSQRAFLTGEAFPSLCGGLTSIPPSQAGGPHEQPPRLVGGPTSRPPTPGGPTSRTTGGPTSTQIWGPTSSPLGHRGGPTRAHEQKKFGLARSLAVWGKTLARGRWGRGCRQACMDAWDDEARVIPFQGEAQEVGRAAKCMAHMGRAHEQQPFATAGTASPRLGEGTEARGGLLRGPSSQGKPSQVSVEGPRAAQPSQAGGPHEQATWPGEGAHEQTSPPWRAHEQDHGRAHEHPNLGAHEQPAKPCGEGPRGPTSKKFLVSRGRWPCRARHWREAVGLGVAGKPAWMPGVMKPGSSHSRMRHGRAAEQPKCMAHMGRAHEQPA